MFIKWHLFQEMQKKNFFFGRHFSPLVCFIFFFNFLFFRFSLVLNSLQLAFSKSILHSNTQILIDFIYSIIN